MKKLVAKKHIQYGGRTYAPGATIPAYDQMMVSAWLRAETAVWEYTEPVQLAEVLPVEVETVAALAELGVEIADEDGNFIGMDALTDNLRAIFAPQNFDGDEDENPESGTAGDQSGQTGYLGAAELKTWKKAELEKLAADMGVDISGAKNNDERAELLAAVPVRVDDDEKRGAQ